MMQTRATIDAMEVLPQLVVVGVLLRAYPLDHKVIITRTIGPVVGIAVRSRRLDPDAKPPPTTGTGLHSQDRRRAVNGKPAALQGMIWAPPATRQQTGQDYNRIVRSSRLAHLENQQSMRPVMPEAIMNRYLR